MNNKLINNVNDNIQPVADVDFATALESSENLKKLTKKELAELRKQRKEFMAMSKIPEEDQRGLIDAPLNESISYDYYVVSDGENPRHSDVFTSSGRESAIARAKSRKGHWEVLHFLDNGDCEKIFEITNEGLNEDINTSDSSVSEIHEFLKEQIPAFIEGFEGAARLIIDDRIALMIGWSKGYGEEHRDDVIQNKDEPDFGLNAGLKVWTSDDLWCDYDYANFPYRKDGDVLDYSWSIEKDEDLRKLAEHIWDVYNTELKDLNMTEYGEIIEDETEEEKDESLDESKKSDLNEEDKALKETWAGEDIISDLADRAKLIYKDGNHDLSDCVSEAIDEGLIYSNDIYELFKHYMPMEDSDVIATYYDDLYEDVVKELSDELDTDDEEVEEALNKLKESKALKEEKTLEEEKIEEKIEKIEDKPLIESKESVDESIDEEGYIDLSIDDVNDMYSTLGNM